MKLLVLAVLVALASAYPKVSHSGYQVWRVDKTSTEVGKALHELKNRLDLDFFMDGVDYAKIIVKPETIHKLGNILKNKKIHHEVIVNDLEEYLAQNTPKTPRVYTPNTYNTYDDIVARLQKIVDDSGSGYASLEVIGNTYENRTQVGINFSYGISTLPTIYIDCGIHAREWISPATCMYGVEQFAALNPDYTSVLNRFNVFIMPVTNPDGYAYTFSDDRLWRKNRNPEYGLCAGVDLNRNFDFEWGGEGTSDQPCSDIYRGPSPSSEIETQNVQNKIRSLSDDSIVHSIHAYSQMWMYAWGYTDTELVPEEAELSQNSMIGVNALNAVYGTNYVYGPIATTIYPAAGNTVDFAYSTGIPYSFTLELRDTGEFGFTLPEDQIIPSGEETWAGLLASFNAKP